MSIERRAAFLTDDDPNETRAERSLPEYRPIAPDLDIGCLRRNALDEFVAERASDIIGRAEEFVRQATPWRF